jgi:hypothetical protein
LNVKARPGNRLGFFVSRKKTRGTLLPLLGRTRKKSLFLALKGGEPRFEANRERFCRKRRGRVTFKFCWVGFAEFFRPFPFGPSPDSVKIHPTWKRFNPPSFGVRD